MTFALDIAKKDIEKIEKLIEEHPELKKKAEESGIAEAVAGAMNDDMK